MNSRSIDINKAKTYARKWQHENSTHAKAFLIPANDLIACLEEMEVLINDGDGNYSLKNVANSGVRAYMAIKRPEETPASPETEKLLIVGTKVDGEGKHRDIIEGEAPSRFNDENIETAFSKLKGSGVYDFTAPCPSECDENSPLYNP